MTRFEKIQTWANSNGFQVKLSNTDCVEFSEKTIYLQSNQSLTNLIYSFLHECGHIEVCKKRGYKKNFKILDDGQFDGRRKRGLLYKYKQLKEEMLAWEYGFQLAKDLGIRLNKENYDKYAAKCFMTYVNNAAFSF
jgi:hypothetical protein